MNIKQSMKQIDPSKRIRRVIGCMSGTSLDGLDAALVEITGSGLSMSAELVDFAQIGFPSELEKGLRQLASGQAMPAEKITELAYQFGQLHAQLVKQLIKPLAGQLVGQDQVVGPDQAAAEHQAKSKQLKAIDFVCAHGQTVYHDGARHLSWQLLNPWPIVKQTGLPVCYDLRQADLMAGGQGAPLTPIADPILYPLHHTAVVNLGGIANVTYWDRRPLKQADLQEMGGGDIGPCNLLLDGLAERLLGQPYDVNGQVAASGVVCEQAVLLIEQKIQKLIQKQIQTLIQEDNQELAPKHLTHQGLIEPENKPISLGREQFNLAWIDACLREDQLQSLSKQDCLCSAVHVVAKQIVEYVVNRHGGQLNQFVLAGGGARNMALVSAIKTYAERVGGKNGNASGGGSMNVCGVGGVSGIEVKQSDELGIAVQAREAMAWAVLGALSQDGVPIGLPQVTGVQSDGDVAGGWVGF